MMGGIFNSHFIAELIVFSALMLLFYFQSFREEKSALMYIEHFLDFTRLTLYFALLIYEKHKSKKRDVEQTAQAQHVHEGSN
jgi:hypothetical protein